MAHSGTLNTGLYNLGMTPTDSRETVTLEILGSKPSKEAFVEQV